MAPRKQPERIGASLDRLTASLAPATPLGSIQTTWRNAVGDRIADRCIPGKAHEGVLTVVCESSVWSQQLTLMQADLLGRLREEIGDPTHAPTELRFVVTGDQA